MRLTKYKSWKFKGWKTLLLVQSLDMERGYTSYIEVCKILKIDKLQSRRHKLCEKFARQEYNKPNCGIYSKT